LEYERISSLKNTPHDQLGSEKITAAQTQAPTPSNRGEIPASPSRRAFLKGFGVATLAGAVPAVALAARGSHLDIISDTKSSQLDIKARRTQAYRKRLAAAADDRKTKTPAHPNNGDENLYPSGIANYTKGFPHDDFAVVDPTVYAEYLAAVKSGKRADFDALTLGGTIPLVDPQAGLAFDLETCDPSQNSIPPFDSLNSPGLAAQMIEAYWQALTRDVPFSQYATDPTIAMAVAELGGLGAAYEGLRPVTTQSIFRGFTAGDVVGPFVSQFFLQPFNYGVMPFQGYMTTLPGDFGNDVDSFLNLQRGAPNGVSPENPDRALKYLPDGRSLAEYVHNDVLYQEYLNAALMLLKMGAPLNPSNPYAPLGTTLKSETGFITFGLPMIEVLVAEVMARALKNAWFQKWFVHRMARSEETAGLVHFTKSGQKSYPLHPSLLNSQAAATVFSRNGNWLLAQSYPEGCPLHPSYPSGHATAAGAAVTVLKWFFDETAVFGKIAGNGKTLPQPLTTVDDGSQRVVYTGADADQLTVGGELNKLASNVGVGRAFAGIHWRQDFQQAMLLGERVAINLLQDQAHLYNENYTGFAFTGFLGNTIKV
jgi:hypothetical protein